MHRLRRLRAGPVLHPRVEPPGAPPVEGDAGEAQALVGRTLPSITASFVCAPSAIGALAEPARSRLCDGCTPAAGAQ